MKRVFVAASVILMSAAVSAFGQQGTQATQRPGTGTPPAPKMSVSSAAKMSISPGEVAPTPEMWFYEQYKSDYQDPKLAVRQKAEFRSEQRLRRLAAAKWFGFSNQRPNCSSDPFHGDWSPAWASNNWFYPQRWQGSGNVPWVVVRPEYYGTVIR